jgi:hypothetical protein
MLKEKKIILNFFLKKIFILLQINTMSSEIIDESLDYSTYQYNHSTLHFRNVSPQTSAAITLSAASVSGPSTFVISSSVFNPAKSRLTFEFVVSTPTSGAGYYTWLQGNLMTLINRIVLYDQNTSAIWADISNCGYAYGLLTPAVTKAEDLRHKSAVLATNVAPAIARLNPFEDIKQAGSTNLNAFGTPVDISGGAAANSKAYQGIQLFVVSAGNNANAAVTVRVSIPFSAFKHSVLSVDKMLYSPSNLQMDIYWNGFNEFVYSNNSATAPSATNEVSAGCVISAGTLQLNLCTEGNVNVASQVISKTMSSGLSLPIGYLTCVRQAVAGTAQSITIPLTAAYGRKILYLATAPFVQQSVGTAATIPQPQQHTIYYSTGTATNMTQYNSFINSVPILAPAGFNVLSAEDYIIANKQYLDGSCILSKKDHEYQWIHVDNFARTKLCELDPANVDGLDVTSQQANWQIAYTFTASETYNHFVVIVGQKTLSISSQGSMVM